ncbi:CapA family protein, partial [Clostridium sp.]|uniref:CapA family protein n=1 Tax=Clostridium sp. TaxID=1506 RepID=UPI002610ECE7
MRRFKRISYIIVLVFLALGLFKIYDVIDSKGVLNLKESKSVGNLEKIEDGKEDKKELEEKKENKEEINIVAVGDFLIHKEILETQYNEAADSYDFKNTVQYVKPYLEKADLAIGNMEGTLSGIENYGFSGYPSFNAPDELADAMKWAGIDVVNNINNHSLDRDNRGYNRTRQTLEEKGFDIIGTRKSSEDKRYIIKDVKGIKVGIISYSYTVVAEGGGRGLNGSLIDETLYPLMNTFREDTIDADLELMKEQINNMRLDGSDIVIFYMHWGEEYALEPNNLQVKMAQYLTDEKVDVIFATHPHSLQPIDILTSSDGMKETPVIYSMGNFLSSQRTERIQNPYTEDGVIVSINVTKNKDNDEIKIDYPTYLPTWVNWYEKNG